jgi:hypothetical protein
VGNLSRFWRRDGQGVEGYGRASKSAASFFPFEYVAKMAAYMCDRTNDKTWITAVIHHMAACNG